jgi:hypothetical protein
MSAVRLRTSALIDSASDLTCVTTTIVQQLGLPFQTTRPTQGVGGQVVADIYLASFAILTPTGVDFVVRPSLPVMELTAPPAGFEVIVGLDVLRDLLLVLAGPAGTFTLAD